MRRFKSIQSAIFSLVTLLVLAVMAIAIALYLVTSMRTFRQNYANSSNQLAKIISSRLDDIMKGANDLEVRMIESDTILEFVFCDFANDPRVTQKERSFIRAVYSIAGYSYPFYHMSILTEDDVLIYFGQNFDYYTLNSGTGAIEYDDAWDAYFATLLEKRGSRVLLDAQAPKLYTGEPAVTVSRSLSRYPLGEHRAIIEMQVSLSVLGEAIDALLLSYDNMLNRVVIFDEAGALVYPAETSMDDLAHYRAMDAGTRAAGPDGRAEFISRYTSGQTGWTVVLVTPYSAINAGMREYILYAVVVSLAAIAITLLAAFWVSRTISRPIISIKETLQNVELDTLKQSNTPDIVTRYNELELLKSSVEEMQTKLERSLDDYVQLRSLSIQSRLLALQSQVNPHFLYNTLSIMSILAEENKDEQVSDMCKQLSAMLRYTSAEREYTTLREELEHTRQYAELVQVRFGDKVSIEYEVDPTLLDMHMPPILLQPLVENCVKYARVGTGPLQIWLRASKAGANWQVSVQDNGPGFTAKALDAFWASVQPAQKAEWDKILHRELEGVGLANIYLRMQLYYEGVFCFEIENGARGVCITIGAPLHIQTGEDG